MQVLINYQWGIFITLEVLSFIALILFGILRYMLNKRKLSIVAIVTFLTLLIVEALLAILIYQETKEIATFQIVVGIFVVYACTFGILDFIKLDRWMRRKIGERRNIELLTKKDYALLSRQKDPKYVAKKYRVSSIIHLVIFVVVQMVLWNYGTADFEEMLTFLTDFSWIEDGVYENSPYANEISYSVGIIWGLVFIVDFIYSWSYTIFPSKPKKG